MLRWGTALLLLGHAGYGAFMHKTMLQDHYAVIGISNTAAAVSAVGWFEVALAAGVLFAPVPALLLFVCAWKMGTELLYPMSGSPFWEWIERGGSYVAPLALFLTQVRGKTAVEPAPRVSPAVEERLA